MLLERAELLAQAGAEAEMRTVLTERTLPILLAQPGVRSANVGQGVENPDKFLLLVEWESLEAHRAFNQAPIATEFRAMLAAVSRGGAMEHFAMDAPATA